MNKVQLKAKQPEIIDRWCKLCLSAGIDKIPLDERLSKLIDWLEHNRNLMLLNDKVTFIKSNNFIVCDCYLKDLRLAVELLRQYEIK